MRITAQAKQATRRRLLETAGELLAARGLGAMTTREVATAAGVGHGTLFNYFPSKEALALAVCAEHLPGPDARPDAATLEESLFALVAAALRGLEPWRASVGSLFGTCFAVLGEDGAASETASELKARHLSAVRALIEARRGIGSASEMHLHLYWSLLVGVLAWWSADDSPHQADTLAVLDQSLRAFVTALPGGAGALADNAPSASTDTESDEDPGPDTQETPHVS